MREPILQLGLHLAEGLIIAVRHEDRIIAEAAGAARRPDERAEDLAFEDAWRRAVWRGERERAGEIGASVGSRPSPRARGARAPWRDRNPCSVRPSAPSGCPARRRAPRPRGLNRRRARSCLTLFAAASALIAAFSAKLAPVSSGSGRPRLARRDAFDAERREQLGELSHLALVVARDDDPRRPA